MLRYLLLLYCCPLLIVLKTQLAVFDLPQDQNEHENSYILEILTFHNEIQWSWPRRTF